MDRKMISFEDRKKIEKFVEAKNRNYRVSSSEVTNLYNKILNKNVRNTGCSSCLRQRISELERKLKQELAEEAKAAEETAEMTENKEDKPKRGRPKKEKEE